jgi:catechol 2,3-dioxygenase-like lactoylglutathione lyase family enzyme
LGNDYSRPGIGFGHIGFTVPNVAETVERVKSFGFEIIKPLDEAKMTQFGMPDDVAQGKLGEVPEGYKHVFKQLAFAKDPDVSRDVENRLLECCVLILILGLLGRVRATGCKDLNPLTSMDRSGT